MTSFNKELFKNDDFINETSKTLFNMADTSKSGLIEKKEFKNLLNNFSRDAEIPLPKEKEIEEIISSFDSNKDGKFAREEFKNFVKLIFEVIYKSLE